MKRKRTHVCAVCSCIIIAVFVVSTFCALCACADTPATEQGETSAAAAAGQPQRELRQGWNAKKTKYFVDDKAVVGAYKVKSTWYGFSAKGKLLKKSARVKGVRLIVKPSGKLMARMKGGKCYYADGSVMDKGDALDCKAYAKAEEILSKITKASDSKKTKRLKAFKWVMRKGYVMHRSWNPSRTSWPAVYAMDHFKGIGGDCHADGAAFAYLAKAAGYKNVYVANDGGTTSEDNHCWCMIDKAVYDPLFAEVKSFSTYYNSKSGSYQVHPAHQTPIVCFVGKSSAGKASKKSASAKKNTWVKKNGSWYYYTSKGVKATGSVKNKKAHKSFKKGAYYVFSKSGKLLKGAKTRVVTVQNKKYRVSKSGRAKPGWAADSSRYFTKTGLMATGVVMAGDTLHAFDETGIHDAQLSAAIAAASAEGSDFAQLQELLLQGGAKVKDTQTQRSCNTYDGSAGDDAMYVYSGGFTVVTFKADTGMEYVISVS